MNGGNYDSENGGGYQLFPPAGMGGGNVQSDLAPFNEEMRFRATPDFDHYASVGFEIMRMQQQQQALMAQQAAMQPIPGPAQGQLALQPAQYGAFNQNWLSERLAAGSANGAKISGMTSKGGGGGKAAPEDASEDSITDQISGEERLQKGFGPKAKDFFGFGANNKFGFGR